MILKLIKKNNINLYAFLIMPLLAGFALMSALFSNLTILEAVKYVLYQILCIYFLGHIIVRLFNFVYGTAIQQFAIEYAVGYAIQIINWYICMLISNLDIIAYLIIAEVVVLLLLYFIKSNKNENNYSFEFNYETFIIVCMLFIFLCLRFVLIQGYNFIPTGNMTNNNHIHNDFEWQIMQTIAVKNSFPVDDFKWLGDIEYYHYFSYISNAVLSGVTGITCSKIVVSLSFISDGILFLSGIAALFQRFANKGKCWLLGVFVFFFTSGVEMYSMVTWSGHLTQIPLGIDIGLAFSALALAIAIDYDREFVAQKKQIFLVFLFIAVSTGSKGPCALVTLVPIGVICLYMIINRRVIDGILLGIGSVISFLVVYCFVDSGVLDRASVNELGGHVSMLSAPLTSFRKYEISNVCYSMADYPTYMQDIFICIRYMIYSHITISFLVIIGIVYLLVCKKKLNEYYILLISGYFAGYFLTSIVNQDGCSEMYFTMTSFIFGCAFIVLFFSDSLVCKKNYILYLCVSVVVLIGVSCYYTNLKVPFSKGILNLVNNTRSEYNINYDRTFRKNLCEGYDWIRENSDYSNIVVSNTVIDDVMAGFDTSIFTERRQWLEYPVYTREYKDEVKIRKNQLQNFYMGNNDELVNQMYNDGVKYVIRVIGIDDSCDLCLIPNIDVVYQNPEIQIGKIVLAE